MRIMAMVLVVFASQAAVPVPDVKTLLRVGSIQVEVLEFVAPERLAELTEKLQAAVASDPEWWTEFVRSAALGEALPYHQKLGLSRSEYTEFLSLQGSMELRVVGTSGLKITSEGQGYRFSADSDLPEMDGLLLDLGSNTVTTKFGIASQVSEIHQADPDSPTGAWDGLQWKLEEGDFDGTLDEMTGVVFKLAVGRIRGQEKGIIYLSVKHIENGAFHVNATKVLRYDLN